MANLGAAGGDTFYSVVDIPTAKAWTLIAAAMVFAGLLYGLGGKSVQDYAVKLADLLMQGAILTILFAVLAKGLGFRLTRRG
jgi:hypothetical protein